MTFAMKKELLNVVSVLKYPAGRLNIQWEEFESFIKTKCVL